MSPNPKKSPSPHPDETDLISKARNGDKDAYRILVQTYQDRVYSLVISMVRQREHAEDVSQDVFVKAYFALHSFKGDSSFFTWIYRIASNTCLDHLRKYKHATVSLDQTRSDDDEASSRLDTLAAPRSDRPEARIEGDPAKLLELISPDQRLILNLREAEGYSYEEIADILKCGVNTVKSRINRAREALKKAYLETYGDGPPMGEPRLKGGNISSLKAVENSEEST